MASLQELVIKGKRIPVPVVQGGMGVGISLHPLASAVAFEGGLGIISSAGLDRLLSKRNGRPYGVYEAVYEEVTLAKAKGGYAGINIMVGLSRHYEKSVKAAIDAGADAIISGAGLPLGLPAIQDPKDTALIPIVSSARALELICRKWERLGYRPDAAVLEGPLAGGHLGFKMMEIPDPAHALENLLPHVIDVAAKFGNFPVIAAGGIFTAEDIRAIVAQGAAGVQMGTRFLATHESSATADYKQAVVRSTEEDIVVADIPGSPCGLPFRVIKTAPMYITALARGRPPRCDKGYLLQRDKGGAYTQCPAKEANETFFCICNGLFSSAGYPGDEEPLYTVGSNAYRVTEVVSVHELMQELKGGE